VRPRLDRSVGRRIFGSDPEAYDAARPGHAGEVYEILRGRCGLDNGSAVLEVGPGTGQATRRLLELGADPLVALEPDRALAEYMRATFGERVEMRVTTLEDAELEAGVYDVAAAASSFHWVEEEVGLDKLLAALRPGGRLALWWTLFGDDTRPDPFRQAVDPLFVDIPHAPSGPAKEGGPSFGLDADARLATLGRAGYEELEHDLFRWTRAWDTEGIRRLYATFSPIGALEPERRAAFLDSIARIAESDFGGVVHKPLVTSLYTARRPL